MTDIIERVARAIAQAYDSAEGESWDVFRWQFEESARLAIAAMREPDKEMVVAGGDALDDCKDSDWDSGCDGESHNSYEWIIPGSQTTIWQAMIDAALSEKESG